MRTTRILLPLTASLAAAGLVPSAAAQSTMPPHLQPVRFASYNAFLNRSSEGELIADLSNPNDTQAQAVAEILQRVRPDVVLLNEFDFDEGGVAVSLFQDNYLAVSQNGAEPIHYEYVFLAPSNTGIPSGLDLDNNGVIENTPGSVAYGNDSFGFGFFPGQFAMVLLSRHPILHNRARTFQDFLWRDMPGALLPDDPGTPEPADWFSPDELDSVRLSSKSHWDVPIQISGRVVHALCAHPTPPIFDGPEDRNGTRNNDEIRFWADYVTPGQGTYIRDDRGRAGGIRGRRFVILGDYNADPVDGDGIPGAMDQLLQNPRVIDPLPASLGGLEAALAQGGANLEHLGNPALDTGDFTDQSDFFDPSGNLRVDYVLPSDKLGVLDQGVFWPAPGEPFFDLVGSGFPVVSSDHRLVWADISVRPTRGDGEGIDDDFDLDFIGEATLPTGLMFEDTEVGGLSALVYQPSTDIYLALSDDRSTLDPARSYTLSLDLSDGLLSPGDVELRDVITLIQRDGTEFPNASIDPEGLALTAEGRAFLSSEGDANAGLDPFVDAFGIAGQQGEPLPVPFAYATGIPDFGIRNNLAFESLTLAPGDRYLFTATENALFQDGPAASTDAGSPSRILVYDLATGDPAAEYVYLTEPVAAEPVPAGSFSTNGLVELLAIDGGTLLALERSFSVGVGNAIRIFRVSLDDADDVLNFQSLAGMLDDLDFAEKELVLDLDDLGITLDNVEGMTFGPTLPDGRRSLVLVSDNNFNPGQFTQFLAFAIDED